MADHIEQNNFDIVNYIGHYNRGEDKTRNIIIETVGTVRHCHFATVIKI